MKPSYSEAVRIRLEPELRPALEALAKSEHLRLSEFVRKELRRVASEGAVSFQRETKPQRAEAS
jgi:predicted HicB family RNase H-like nuclease